MKVGKKNKEKDSNSIWKFSIKQNTKMLIVLQVWVHEYLSYYAPYGFIF